MITIKLEKDEAEFLSNLILKEMQDIAKVKSRYNIIDKNSENAKYFYDSFFRMDEFLQAINKKLAEAF